MQNKVTIEPDDLGNVIRVSKTNSEYGHVRITQENVGFSANGWVNNRKLSALIHGTVEDLTIVGIADMKTLPGKIYIRESVDPFSADDPDRDLKIAGETGIVCCSHGQPIYRKSFYDQTGTQADDLVPHTNGDAIKEANGASKAANNADLTKNAATISDEDLAKIKDNIDDEVKIDDNEEVLEEIVEDEKEESFEL